MSPFAISLIVCTRNRANQLRRALTSCAELSFDRPWELIVVNNGSSDETASVLSAFAEHCPFPVVIVDEPTPGLSRARNRGLAHARGRVVAFTDDDCYPAPDFLAAIHTCFSSKDIAYCGGRVLLFDPTDRRITIQESNIHREIAPNSYIRSGWIHGANMAFVKETAIQLGGFDERFGAGGRYPSGEDTDLLRRFSAAGLSGVYDPAIMVYHHHGRKTAKEEADLLRGYAKGVGACMMKYCLHKPTRALYLRHGYWTLRDSHYQKVFRVLLSGVKFFVSHGLVPSRAFAHPREGLATPVLSATDEPADGERASFMPRQTVLTNPSPPE